MINIANILFIALLLPYAKNVHSKSLRSVLPGPHLHDKHQVSLDNSNLADTHIPESPRKLQTSGYSVVQIGDDFDGEDYYGRSGSALALSGNGKLLAIGAHAAYGYTGHVLTHIFDDDTGSWFQYGQKILGEDGGDHSGSSLSMSHDGTTMAIGAPNNGYYIGHTRVFGWDVDSQLWVQIGVDLDGAGRNDKSGAAVALSGDGQRLAIGSPDANGLTGYAKIYERNGNSWNQLGSIIRGEDYYSALGNSLALTDDGQRVVIGSEFDREDSTFLVGSVSVYEYSDGDWVRVGQDLNGEAYYDLFGHSVDISGDGSRIVIGVPNDDDNGSNSGSAIVYQYDDTVDSWLELGTTLMGENIGDGHGSSVSMSQDGNRVVVGTQYHDGAGQNAGSAQIYQYDADASEWSKVGDAITGRSQDDNSGGAVVISPDGDTIVVGAPLGNYYNGHTRAYKISAITTSSSSEMPSQSTSSSPSTSPSVSQSASPTASQSASPTVSQSSSPSVSHSEVQCVDSPLEMDFVNPLKGTFDCSWVAQDLKNRCNINNVASHCPSTCNVPLLCSEDSSKRFVLAGTDKKKRCSWAASNPERQCRKPGIRETCRSTCDGF